MCRSLVVVVEFVMAAPALQRRASPVQPQLRVLPSLHVDAASGTKPFRACQTAQGLRGGPWSAPQVPLQQLREPQSQSRVLLDLGVSKSRSRANAINTTGS